MTSHRLMRASLPTVLVAALALMGCGGSGGTTTTTGPSTTQPAAFAACAAKDRLAASIDKLAAVARQPEGGGFDLVAQFDKVRLASEEVAAEAKKLPAETQPTWEEAVRTFRLSFVDVGLDLVDAVRGSNPAADTKKVVKKLSRAYETAYADVDCP